MFQFSENPARPYLAPLILIILSLLTRTTLAAPAPSTPAPPRRRHHRPRTRRPHPIQQPPTGRYFYPAHGTDIPLTGTAASLTGTAASLTEPSPTPPPRRHLARHPHPHVLQRHLDRRQNRQATPLRPETRRPIRHRPARTRPQASPRHPNQPGRRGRERRHHLRPRPYDTLKLTGHAKPVGKEIGNATVAYQMWQDPRTKFPIPA